jgi:hypothetical protein
VVQALEDAAPAALEGVRRSGLGKPRWTIRTRVLPFSSSKVTVTRVRISDPSGIFIVELKTRRRGRSTSSNSRDV